ncbi:restriction endonuclease subunit S, partial [Faecalibaculum rodentium]|uniref:restriction endonuclease subunit S n=2 Tax=Faecalibaculum rodentium TaxID=1702221 RepID=UPI0026E92E44
MNSVQLKDLCSVKSSTLKAGDVKNMNPGQYPVYGASGLIADIDSFQHENPALAIVKDGAGFGRVYKTPKKSSVVGTMQFILPNEDVDRDYLYYVLNHIDFNKYRSGATIPHIYFKDYSSVQIKKHSLSEQRIIAEKLDGVTGLIDKSYAELEEFDQLVKSRFIEMFGDTNNSMEWPI